ncbi:MAG: DUF935 family protein [Acidobacteriota bacterium]
MSAPPILTAKAVRPHLARELAGADDVETLWHVGGEVPHPSRILRTKSAAHGATRLGELYAVMSEKGGVLHAIYATLADHVLALERWIEPGDASPKAHEAAQLVRHALEGIASWETHLRHQMEARARGLAVDELIWDELARGPHAGALVPVEAIDRPIDRFCFKRPSAGAAVLHVHRPDGKPTPAPPGKFLVARHGTKDSPWGRAELDAQYVPWWMTQHFSLFWTIALDRWADPKPKLTFPWHAGRSDDARAANEEAQAQALETLAQIAGDDSIAVPEGWSLDLLEATRSASVSYEAAMLFWVRVMWLIALGEMQNSGLQPGHGSFAKDEVAKSLLVQRIKLVAKGLSSHIREALLRPITEVNFGPGVEPPHMRIDVSQAEDVVQRREGLAIARALGLERVPARYVRATLLVPEAQPGEEVFEWPEERAPSRAEGSDDADESDAETADDANEDDERETGGPSQNLEAPDVVQLAEEPAPPSFDALDQIAERLRVRWIEHTEALRARVLESFEVLVEDVGAGWTAIVRPVGRSLGALLHTALVHAQGQSLADLLADGATAQDLLDDVEPAEALLDLPLEPLQLSDSPDDGALESVDLARQWWADRLALPRALFLGLDDELRRLAFTIAGVQDVRLLLEIEALVARASTEGMDFDLFRDELAAIYEARGLEPTAPQHADLVLRNAMRQVHGAMRWRHVMSPSGRRAFPYLRWRTIDDDRVRERPRHNHAVMDGAVFAVGHSIWRTWWYPAGHGCRCSVATVARGAARRLGLEGDEPRGPWPLDPFTARPAVPDPGFAGAPRLGEVAERMREQLREQLEGARRQGAPSIHLLDEIEHLLDVLFAGL